MISAVFVLFSGILFMLGTVVGSFLNVVIYRSVTGESWVKGRSHCESCGKQIHWYDNIPLFSYLILGGKCRACSASIAISHPVIEFLTGTLFVWWYWGGTFFFRLTQQPFQAIQPLFWLLVGVILLIIFFADILYGIIPDEAVVALTIVTFIYRIALTLMHVMQLSDFVQMLGGAVLCIGFFAGLHLLTKGKGMGLGDVKFALPIALILGWPDVLVGVLSAFIIGSLVAIILLLTKKKKIKQTVPFGPFLVVGVFVALLWGEQIVQWYKHLCGF